MAAALMPVNCNDEDDDEDDACTSFNGPYADSDDDIGNVQHLHGVNTIPPCIYRSHCGADSLWLSKYICIGYFMT